MAEGVTFFGTAKRILMFLLWMFISQIPMTLVMFPLVLKEAFPELSENFPSDFQQQSQIFMYLGLISAVGVLVLFYYLYEKEREKNPVSYVKLTQKSPHFWKYLLWGLLGCFLLLVLETILANLQVPDSANQQVLEVSFTQSPIIFSLLVTVFAPLSEELLYRGFFFNYFFRKNDGIVVITGVVANALLFALLHDTTFTLVTIPYLLMGALFAYSYRKSGDLKVPMALHFANNLLATILMWGSL